MKRFFLYFFAVTPIIVLALHGQTTHAAVCTYYSGPQSKTICDDSFPNPTELWCGASCLTAKDSDGNLLNSNCALVTEVEGIAVSTCEEWQLMQPSQLSPGDLPSIDPKENKNITTLINPIGGKNGTDEEKAGVTSLNVIVGRLIKAALGILGSVTLLVFMYGGFLWLTSRGSSEKIKEGLDAMVYAGVGIFIIFSSYAILSTILNGLK